VKQRNEEPVIVFELDTAGRIALGDYTTKHRGEQLAILLNGSVLTAPLIDQPLTEGVGEISGQFTIDEAKMITTSLLTGNIPLKLKVVETKQIEPTLSNENLKNGIYSILVAVTVLVGWLLYYYKPYHGGVVVLGLFVNVFLVFDVIYTLEINITLMGLVAILLTLGMNVDNNILIQEKHREGYPILESYDKAKRGIFDANITTLLMGLVLYGFGQENIKQFGFMLLVGIVGGIYSGFYFTKSLYKNKEAKQWKH
jgi:protein-export membrane protein SecD